MLRGRCNGNGYGPHSTANYHRTHSGDHVTKVAETPCHPSGAVLLHHVVHKESFKEVDGAKAPANGRCFNNYPMNNAMAANHHGGGSHHRYEAAYEETHQESYEEDTYAYGGAGRHHGHDGGGYHHGNGAGRNHGHDGGYHHGHGAGGGHRFEYQTHEETYDYEEEEEVVVGGGGCAQLRRGYRGA